MKNILLHITFKKLSFLVVFTFLLLFFNINEVYAQDNSSNPSLLPNQNPNYHESLEKYQQTDSLTLSYTSMQGQTLQQTYKAIDPRQDRLDARRNRRNRRVEFRHERRMARINNTSYWGGGYGGYYGGYGGYNDPLSYIVPTAVDALLLYSLFK